jgi:hypothetical protein
MGTAEAEARPIRSLIPARLDRLNWSPFHTRLVCGLGGAWILDGLQITAASSVSGELTKSSTLGMTSTQVGLIGTGSSRTGLFWGYLIGAGIMVIGGLVEIFLGVNAAGKSLEQVTKPLTSASDEAAVPATTAVPTAPARLATA